MKTITLLLFINLFFYSNLKAQNNTQQFWSSIGENAIEKTGKRQIVPQKYLTFQLINSDLKTQLLSAPLESKVKINESACVITLPLPNGTIQHFKVVESPIMEKDLANSFPNIKTYSIKGIDDPYANGKLDWNEFGFHGMVRSVKGDFFIDPYCLANIKDYITYYTADFEKDPSQKAPEIGVVVNPKKTNTISPKKKQQSEKKSSLNPATCSGSQLKTYRMAVACTGEYAVAATGTTTPTIAQTLSKIVTSINRVDGLYENEVAVRLILVATETNVIFTNASTDPFSGNNNGSILIGESQTVITNSIGIANFDIGHTFSTGGGGLANLGVVCDDSQKASGITGSGLPVGDPYDVDYVAHEVGHQFSGNHTFNSTVSSCGGGNRNGSTAVEPGSGITIMAYAGICGSQDLATHSIAYFHAISYDEIVNFTTLDIGSTCPVTTTTGNNPPVVIGSGNYIIPKSTPFILNGSGTDPDGDSLTFSWEETELGISGNWNSGKRNYFRSYNPTISTSRLFPKQSVVLSGNYIGTKGEYVPPSAQTLEFRLTARDNKMGGGGVCYAINSVTIDNSGPLTITYPDTINIVWNSGSQQIVTWDVNGTNVAPVSCDSVSILISYDSGTTYSMLLNSVANDGLELITVPTITTASIPTCRIKIASKGNIFYDVNNKDFKITFDVGIKQFSKNNTIGLSVWPNPFTQQVNFAVGNLNAGYLTDVKVMDVLGKTLLQKNYSNKTELNETLDLSLFNQGIYFISVTNDNKSAYYRIVKN